MVTSFTLLLRANSAKEIDILGFFLGYMSGPITVESTEEQQERMKRVVMLPEPASSTGIALEERTSVG
jgi:hypothetical protein